MMVNGEELSLSRNPEFLYPFRPRGLKIGSSKGLMFPGLQLLQSFLYRISSLYYYPSTIDQKKTLSVKHKERIL